MILTIFAALVSDSDPPNTVKSWAKANTWRPSTSPWPATTPSPGTICSAMPKSTHRWVTSLSTSSKLPGSNSSSMRSRAVSLPASCCRRRRFSPPPSSARRFRSVNVSLGFIDADEQIDLPRKHENTKHTYLSCFRAFVLSWLIQGRSHLHRRMDFFPVLQELLEPAVGERVIEQGIDH